MEGRPDYPPEIENWLIQDLGLSKGKTALDLAAGDRILSVNFVAALPADQRAYVTAQLLEVIATYPELAGKAEVTFPYETLPCVCAQLT